MATGQDYPSFNDSAFGEWCGNSGVSSLNMDFVTSEELLFPQNTPEPPLPSALLDLEYLYGLFLETPSDTGSAQGIPSSSSRSLHDAPEPSNFSPQVVTPVDEGTSLWTACSTSTSTPQSQVSTFPPLNWRKIPQKSYDHGQKQWDFRASTPISFTVNGFPGVNMRDALNGNFTDLDGRDEPVLQNAPGSAISCRLSFPGYPPNKSSQISTLYWGKRRDPIKRSKLAQQVARKVERYLNSMTKSHIIDGSTNKRWKIGEGFMKLENMFLVRLESVSRGSFQPEIWVVDPTM